MNGVYFYFVNKLFLVGRYWDFDMIQVAQDPIFVGVSLGNTLQSPSLVPVKPRKDMNNVNCGRDMTEILLKVA